MEARFVGVKRGHRPNEVRRIIQTDFSVNISYYKEWCAQEVAMDKVISDETGSYALLPNYFQVLIESKPGSICRVVYEDDAKGLNRFRQ